MSPSSGRSPFHLPTLVASLIQLEHLIRCLQVFCLSFLAPETASFPWRFVRELGPVLSVPWCDRLFTGVLQGTGVLLGSSVPRPSACSSVLENRRRTAYPSYSVWETVVVASVEMSVLTR